HRGGARGILRRDTTRSDDGAGQQPDRPSARRRDRGGRHHQRFIGRYASLNSTGPHIRVLPGTVSWTSLLRCSEIAATSYGCRMNGRLATVYTLPSVPTT